MKTLRIHLENGTAPVDFDDFGSFAFTLADVLRRSFRAEYKKVNVIPRFGITEIHAGSVAAEIASTDSFGDRAIDIFIETVGSIRRKERPQFGFSAKDIRTFRKLADPLDSHTKQIHIANLPIDDEFIAGCQWLLNNCPKSYGQTIGRLDGMNIHRARFFRLYPEGNDAGAECYFEPDLLKPVIACIGKRVRVEGLIHWEPSGIGIDRITDIRAFEQIPDELPSLIDLFGLYENTPIKVSSEWRD